MAGGLGTRLRPLTDTLPKCLVPVGGRPLLEYWFDRFAEAGLRDVRINTHHLPDQVRAYIAAKNAARRFRVSEAFEPALLGSGGTVHENRDFVPASGECLIVYADNLSSVDLGAMIDFHRAHGDPMTMLLFRTPSPEKCGIAELDSAGRVVGFEEKPPRPKGNLANAGVYMLTGAAYHEMAHMKAFDLGFDVLPRFIGRMRGFAFEGYHRDIGTMESLRQAETDLATVYRAALGGRAPSELAPA
ncbi:MAG: nucleotidyltransferase family protein [Phycisphaerales bacterium]|nr:nucleotidyltransferase family protein [Phycisphaerales bacterium]